MLNAKSIDECSYGDTQTFLTDNSNFFRTPLNSGKLSANTLVNSLANKKNLSNEISFV